MNAESAGKAGRVALLYIGLAVAVVYLMLLFIAPFCVIRLYRLNSALIARVLVLETEAKAKTPAVKSEPMIAPVVLNFYGNAELVPRGQRPKTKTY
ncbi:hypothetical protein CCP3SC15_360008 [Gammaproteobacteria bacterium]